MSKTETTIPGKQTLVFVLSVDNAINETKIAPEFSFYLSGNDDSDKVTISTDNNYIIVSAAPLYNIKLVRNSNVNRIGYYDFSVKDQVDSKTDTSIYGRMQGYGIVVQLYNTSEDKELKGIELPNGDINFDVTFNELIGKDDVTNQEGYMPILWDYKENTNFATGKNGNNMNLDNNSLIGRSIDVPYNKGGTLGFNSCYNGGTWSMIQDEMIQNKYHVTIKGYEFDPSELIFPTNASNDSAFTTIRFGKNIGCFSAGYLQVLMQMPEEVGNTQSIYMRVETSNLNATSLSGQVTNLDQNEKDNLSNVSITLYPTGVHTK